MDRKNDTVHRLLQGGHFIDVKNNEVSQNIYGNAQDFGTDTNKCE